MKKKTFVLALICLLSATLYGSISHADEVVSNEESSITNNNDAPATVSKVMTFNEMAAQISKDSSITILEAQKILLNDSGYNSISKLHSARKAPTYRHFTQQFTVNSNYKPTVRFYCETEESSTSFRSIKKIKNVELIRGYKGVSKQFSGSIYVKLEDANKFIIL